MNNNLNNSNFSNNPMNNNLNNSNFSNNPNNNNFNTSNFSNNFIDNPNPNNNNSNSSNGDDGDDGSSNNNNIRSEIKGNAPNEWDDDFEKICANLIDESQINTVLHMKSHRHYSKWSRRFQTIC